MKEGASIGVNSVLLAGIVVGRYAMVGAGSVLTNDTQDFELVYGNPAKHRGYVCKCAKKLSIESSAIIKCSCGLKYEFGDSQLWEV